MSEVTTHILWICNRWYRSLQLRFSRRLCSELFYQKARKKSDRSQPHNNPSGYSLDLTFKINFNHCCFVLFIWKDHSLILRTSKMHWFHDKTNWIFSTFTTFRLHHGVDKSSLVLVGLGICYGQELTGARDIDHETTKSIKMSVSILTFASQMLAWKSQCSRHQNASTIVNPSPFPWRWWVYEILCIQKRKIRISEHQTKTGKEWWRNVSPSQGLLQCPISETEETPERAKRFSTIPFPSLSDVLLCLHQALALPVLSHSTPIRSRRPLNDFSVTECGGRYRVLSWGESTSAARHVR